MAGIDILQVSPKEKAVLAKDYFTWFLFGKVIKTKYSERIIEFIKEVNDNLKITKLISDNGKEFI